MSWSISVVFSYLSCGKVSSTTGFGYVMGILPLAFEGAQLRWCASLVSWSPKNCCEFWPTSLVWQSQPALLTVHFSVRDCVSRCGRGWHACLFICLIFKLICDFWILSETLHCWEGSQCFSFLKFFSSMVTSLVSGKQLLDMLMTRETFGLLQTYYWLNKPLYFEFHGAHLHWYILVFSVHQEDHSDAEHSDPGPLS